MQVGGSLIDIPKDSILSRRDVEAQGDAGTAKLVDITIEKDAKVMQRIPVTASSVLGLESFGGQVSACACACECNCACDCACGSQEEWTRFLRTMAFRNPMIPRSAARY